MKLRFFGSATRMRVNDTIQDSLPLLPDNKYSSRFWWCAMLTELDTDALKVLDSEKWRRQRLLHFSVFERLLEEL